MAGNEMRNEKGNVLLIIIWNNLSYIMNSRLTQNNGGCDVPVSLNVYRYTYFGDRRSISGVFS